jgi:hypothetical protein
MTKSRITWPHTCGFQDHSCVFLPETTREGLERFDIGFVQRFRTDDFLGRAIRNSKLSIIRYRPRRNHHAREVADTLFRERA